MSDRSAIEWTDATWNPVRGCVKVSPGCAHCYAETFAERFRGVPGHPYAQGFDLRLVPEKLTEPLRWKTPRRVFVNSMSDLFQDGVPDDYIDQVFAVMALAPQHTFQVLTKRPARMLRYCTSLGRDDGECEPDLDGEAMRDAMIEGAAHAIYRRLHPREGDPAHGLAVHQPLPNVWLGVSVENQPCADERIPLLLQTPAAIRFISAEPLLGPIDVREMAPDPSCRLHWVIIGGESGPGARPCEVAWARSLVAQCRAAGVACFVKQLGANPRQRVIYGPPTFESDQAVHVEELRLKNRKGGDMAEWPADLRVRAYPIQGG